MDSYKNPPLDKHKVHFAFQFPSKTGFSLQHLSPQAMTDPHFNQSIDLSVCLTLSFSDPNRDHLSFLRQQNSYYSRQCFVPL